MNNAWQESGLLTGSCSEAEEEEEKKKRKKRTRVWLRECFSRAEGLMDNIVQTI